MKLNIFAALSILVPIVSYATLPEIEARSESLSLFTFGSDISIKGKGASITCSQTKYEKFIDGYTQHRHEAFTFDDCANVDDLNNSKKPHVMLIHDLEENAWLLVLANVSKINVAPFQKLTVTKQ